MKKLNWDSIGPAECVPESFSKKWGGKWGCPVKKGGKVIGYVENMPNDESDENNVMASYMAL